MSPAALITGATGQDGFFLARRLLSEGWTVHAVARDVEALSSIPDSAAERSAFHAHPMDIMDGPGLVQVLRVAGPTEIYNLAGQSSVSGSFADPVLTWRANAESVVLLLEAVRREAPGARLYQASSGEMFGWGPEPSVVHDESSPFRPQSPYAVAKAAAHLACATYRNVYGLRIASGILFNHESHRRSSRFLTRKVVDHVRRVKEHGPNGGDPPLRVGNLRAQRDWGFAPDYVDGIVAVLRQVTTRATRAGGPLEADEAGNYRDYVLATGQLHAVWELIDRAFSLADMELTWRMESADELTWHARFSDGSIAVEVDPDLLRPSDPDSIAADPALARQELGWSPRVGLDTFLRDMLDHG